jgi:hypothetical protein
VHVEKGDMEGKFWLDAGLFEIIEDFSFNYETE